MPQAEAPKEDPPKLIQQEQPQISVEEKKEEPKPEAPIEIQRVLVVTDDIWCLKKVRSTLDDHAVKTTFAHDSV